MSLTRLAYRLCLPWLAAAGLLAAVFASMSPASAHYLVRSVALDRIAAPVSHAAQPVESMAFVQQSTAIASSGTGFDELLINGGSPGRTQDVAWGDMDGDGDLDLAVANHYDVIAMQYVYGGIYIYRNQGGAFQALYSPPGQPYLGKPGDRTTAIAWGDLDGDGDLDLAATTAFNDNHLYRNLGDGRFTEILDAAGQPLLGHVENYSRDLAMGDLDGDGDLDLVIANFTGDSQMYRNLGDGRFEELAGGLPGSGAAMSAALGDMDSDSDLDLAIGTDSQGVLLYRNSGDGLLVKETTVLGFVNPYVGDQNLSLAWGDPDNDGDLDLAVGRFPLGIYLHGGLYLYHNLGGGQFDGSAVRLSSDDEIINSLEWGDVDNDGDLDLAAGIGPDLDTGQDNPNRLYRNLGGGAFEEAVDNLGRPLLGTNIRGASILAWGDTNGDGSLDLAAGGESAVYIYRSLHSSPFEEALNPDGNPVLGDINATNLAWGDMDGDGDLDLALGNGSSSVQQNQGSAGFRYVGVVGDVAPATMALAWGDMDGDGDLDLATDHNLYRNLGGDQGSGWFQEVYPTGIGILGSISSLAWGDMDNDGDLDLAFGASGTTTDEGAASRIYRNLGDGQIEEALDPGGAPALGNTPRMTMAVAWGDMDGDGDLDLALGNTRQPNTLYRNLGGSRFEEVLDSLGNPALGAAAENTTDLAWGDMDGDSDLDLAVSNSGQPNRLFRNLGGEQFEEALTTQGQPVLGIALEDSSGIAWGDMDNDGDLDLAISNLNQPNRLFRNLGDGTFIEALDEQGQPVLGATTVYASDIAWGDFDGDGDLDLASASTGEPSRLYRNTLLGSRAVTMDAVPFLAVRQPSGLAAANFYAISGALSSGSIPFTYTLYSPGINPLARIAAQFSLDGGGNWITASGSTPTNTAGLWESFSPIAAGQWQLSPGAVLTTGLCSKIAGPALNFDGPLTMTRQAATRPLDLRQGGRLSFWLNNSGGGPGAGCNAPENGENILLEYSLDGSSWTPLAEYAPPAPTALTYGYQRVEMELPAAARSPATRLRWRQPVFDEPSGDNWALDEVRIDIPHVFLWDTFASGFFGQSANVVLRLQAIPTSAGEAITGTYRYPQRTAGSFQQAQAAATTLPFPARGTQVRVMDESGVPAPGAYVYQLHSGQMSGARPVASQAGEAFRTDPMGYLQGRGAIGYDDTLFALAPVSSTTRYDLYATNAVPYTASLKGYIINLPGIQIITVTRDHPLLLFNLDITAEWDPRNDPGFLENLDYSLKKTAAVLFDTTNGQVALGEVRLHLDRQDWTAADVVLYAQTGIRPRASMGGVVDAITDDVVSGTLETIPAAYGPGQVRMGPNWDPFGSSTQEFTLDWQRAFAHELAHYLLYLPDNYLGTENGQPVGTDCRGSFMTSTYDDDYSEFLIRPAWTGDCTRTIAQNTTRRVDWETLQRFYRLDGQPMLQAPANLDQTNPGPTDLPLDITSLVTLDPNIPAQAITPRFIDVRLASSGQLKSAPRAQAFLFHTRPSSALEPTAVLTDDQVIALGSTLIGGDRFKLRGALPGDRLCLFGPPDLSGVSYAGCIENLDDLDTSLFVRPLSDWEPTIAIQGVTSTTLQVTVTLAAAENALNMQFFPAYGSPGVGGGGGVVQAPVVSMKPSADGTLYTVILDLPDPAFEGWLRVWVPGSDPIREAMSQVFLSPPWGPNRGTAGMEANQRAWGANFRQLGAPVASGDGQVSIFNFKDIFADTGTLSLQALNSLPGLPAWLNQVGQGYRFLTHKQLDRAIAFDYLQREVPPGYEYTLTIYYSPDDGASWQRLPTTLEQDENRATAIMPANPVLGRGLYGLFATVEMPPLYPGWNLFSFTIPVTRPITQALGSLNDAYTSILHFDKKGGRWTLYDPAVPLEHPQYTALVNDLYALAGGQAYWLHATQVITPYLGIPGPGEQPGMAEAGLGQPPMTFYGPALDTADFHPAAGMFVQAWLGPELCGNTKVIDFAGRLAYRLQAACAAAGPGSQLRLTVDGASMLVVPWDNTHALYLPLSPVQSAPVFTAVPDQQVIEGATLTISLSASSQAAPGSPVTLTLSAPADAALVGMALDPAGRFTWTPSEAQGPGVYPVTVIAEDLLDLTAAETFTITVLEVNQPPAVSQPGFQQVAEGSLLTVAILANDSLDFPTNPLTYSLLSPKSGMQIDPHSGVFTWTPSELQGPGAYTVTVEVTDGGVPALAAQAQFSILVGEVNTPPSLPSPGDQSILQGETLTLTLAASDSDLPANTLTYLLITGPGTAQVDSASGRFTWTPSLGDGAGTYPVTVRVVDDGAPARFAETTFYITVSSVTDLRLEIAQRDDPAILGATAFYTLTAANFGLYPATGLVFTATLPAGLLYLDSASAPGCAAVDAQTAVCGLATLHGQNAAAVVIAASVVDPALEAQPLLVTARLSAAQGDTDPANNQAQISTAIVRSRPVYTASPFAPGPEWSPGVLTSTTPSGQPFFGEFNNQTIDLTLRGLPDHRFVEVYFDLYILRSWNGNSRTEPLDPAAIPVGPDVWVFEAQAQTRLQTSFSNYGTGFQSFPGAFPFGSFPGRSGAYAVGSLGYSYNGLPGMDTNYRLGFRFPDSAANLWLRFKDLGLQPLANESWGIANLSVVVDGGYLPSSFLPLMLR